MHGRRLYIVSSGTQVQPHSSWTNTVESISSLSGITSRTSKTDLRNMLPARLLLDNQRSRPYEGQMIPAHPSLPQKEVPPVLDKLPRVLDNQPQGIMDLLGSQRPFPPRLLGNQRPTKGKSLSPTLTRNKNSQKARPSPNARCRFAIFLPMNLRTRIVLHVRGPK